MPAKRTTVLFVDDEATFLEAVQGLMRAYSGDQWTVLAAPDAARALALIREHKIDLLVIDLHMPVIDGLQFLTLLHRKYPNILKVVLTGDATESYRAACLSNGAELFLEKPSSPEGWENIYSALNEIVRFQPEDGFLGVLRRVGLQDILQMECLARSSSILEVIADTIQGGIYVQDGQIIHAHAGGLMGEDAFNQLMLLSGGQFNLKPFAEPPARTISGSWEFLLMEAARKRDESQAAQSATSDVETAVAAAAELALAESALAAPAPAADEAPVCEPPADTVPANGAVAAPAPVLRPRIDELLICSTHGDVLYEWHCGEANARIRFLQFLSQKSWQLRQSLPIGQFQRLEIEGVNDRIVTQVAPDRALFMRARRVPVAP